MNIFILSVSTSVLIMAIGSCASTDDRRDVPTRVAEIIGEMNEYPKDEIETYFAPQGSTHLPSGETNVFMGHMDFRLSEHGYHAVWLANERRFVPELGLSEIVSEANRLIEAE